MASLIWWQAIHALCILGHIGMFVFGFISFAFNGFAFNGFGLDTVLVPWAAGGLGFFGTQVNLSLFYRLQKARLPLDRGLLHQAPVQLDSRPVHLSRPEGNRVFPSPETPETVYYQTRVTILVGSIFNLFFLGADWSLAARGIAVDSKSSSGFLKLVCVLAIFAGAAALATIAADVVKALRDRAHQREIEQRDFDETDVEYRDDEED